MVIGLQALPHDVIDAGCESPEEIVAVVRPASFNSSTEPKNLDVKQIVQENLEMIIKIIFKAENTCTECVNVFSGQVTPSFQKGFRGFYIFQLQKECPKLFEKAGIYTFLFSLVSYLIVFVKFFLVSYHNLMDTNCCIFYEGFYVC